MQRRWRSATRLANHSVVSGRVIFTLCSSICGMAARELAPRLGLSETQVRASLERGRTRELEETALYRRVFEVAAERGATPARASIPQIELHSVKITRPLTTEWFANRVAERHRRCMTRGG